MKAQELMTLIDQAAQDETVKKDPQLFQDLMDAYKELDADKDIKIVIRKLDTNTSRYLMTHEYKAPEGLLKLAKAIQKDANGFWKGTGISKLFW